MTSFRFINDLKVNALSVFETQILPNINSTDPPSSIYPGGGIGYDLVTHRVYYDNGTVWTPLQPAGSTPSTIYTYCLQKNGDALIPQNLATRLALWTTTPDPPFHDTTAGWDLTAGIYTANSAQSLTISASISWKSGYSNQGYRYLYIYYQPSLGIAQTIGQVVAQPNASLTTDTTQTLAMNLALNTGDQVWVEVYQTSAQGVYIEGGVNTTISGFRSN
jgi:hypothetical protein